MDLSFLCWTGNNQWTFTPPWNLQQIWDGGENTAASLFHYLHIYIDAFKQWRYFKSFFEFCLAWEDLELTCFLVENLADPLSGFLFSDQVSAL